MQSGHRRFPQDIRLQYPTPLAPIASGLARLLEAGGAGPYPDGTDEEVQFLRHRAFTSTPRRVTRLLARLSTGKLASFLPLFVLTMSVGLGYCYGFLKYPPNQLD